MNSSSYFTRAGFDPTLKSNSDSSRQFSLLRAINTIVRTGHLSGIEDELSKETAKVLGEQPVGFFVPLGDFAGRAMSVGSATQGGNFVQSDVVGLIEILRNKLVSRRLGVRLLGNLQGNTLIPRITATATSESLTETGTITPSNATVNQLSLTPKRVGASTTYSKQLLLQSSPDLEALIRDDLAASIATKMDLLTLVGGGANEPVGIASTASIGSVTFGAAATWDKILAFESSLATANADVGQLAWATTPAVRAKWKAIPKVAASTTPIFLWEDGNWSDGTNDGKVNGYRATATNQLSNGAVLFGNFADAVLGMWGGLDVVVDPYTQAKSAQVEVTINAFIDVGVRHAASFVLSADSGAQ